MAAAFLCAAGLNALAGVEQTVNGLLPKLAAEKVEDRYAPQMELQAIALHAARPGAEAERAALASLLASKAIDSAVPQPARVWVVRQLEYIGAAESVPALSKLLAGQDAELKECARRALEKDPAPAAGEVLRAALTQAGDTTWKVGLIQSLGERRDTQAVELIARQLTRKETAPAAASALGKIADPKAVSALWGAYDIGVPGTADALIVAGNQLISAKDKSAAKDIFSWLYLAGGTQSASANVQLRTHPPAPLPVRSAALIGWAKCDSDSVRAWIEGALRQPQPELEFAAVTAATVAYGNTGISALMAPLFPQLPPTAKVYALRVLDAAHEKQVIAAVGDPNESVRVAAIERLGQIGTAASIPALFTAAKSGSATGKAAAAALASIADPGADAAIAQKARDGQTAQRVVAINALAARGQRSAAPALLQYARQPDPEVSAAACMALAKVGTDQELDGLIHLVLGGKAPCAEPALQAVASRAKDKSAAAAKVVAQTQSAQPAQLAPLFGVLVMLGGKDALLAVSSAATSSNSEVKDAAIRALAGWPDFAAAQSLLAIATSPQITRVQNVLAIQGVARLVKSADKEPAATRVDTALAAMKAATRDDEKKLLLSALASVPDKKAAQAIQPYLSDPKFQQDAALAAMNLAESLRKPDRPTAKELAQAVKDAALSPDLTKRADAILKKN